MTVTLNFTWAIVLLPLVGAGAAFLAESPRRAAQTGTFFTALAFVVALVVLFARLTHAVPAYVNTQTFWDLLSTSSSGAGHQPIAGEYAVFWGIRVDPLSLTFMVAVLLLSLITQLYALASMRGEPGLRRFFWVSEVLTFGLLALVVSPNLFQFLLGWTVTGVAAWMLAAQHWQRPATPGLATRTFVVLHVADLALLVALVMTFAKFGVAVAKLPVSGGQTTSDTFSFSTLGMEWHLGHIGAVSGVGSRTLVVIAALFVVAAAIRAALGPLHVWLSGALDAPPAGLALLSVAALLPATILLARVYPLLLEAPHLLSALAVTGTAGAAAGAVMAIAQRDLFRIGTFAVSSQAGLALATIGMGGYSPGLFIAFTGSFLSVVFFLAAGNLSRGYRSTDITDHGGGRTRMPRTTTALGAWAVGISGLSLNTYSALSATLRNALPPGGHVSRLTEVVVALGVLVTIVLTALYAFRVYFLVGEGEPTRRRGFDATRLREVGPQLSRPLLAAVAGAVVATLVGIPGLSAFHVGSLRIPGLTFSHFVFYGPFRQQLALDPIALLLAIAAGVGGAAAARRLFSAQGRTAPAPASRRLERAAAVLAAATPAERLAGSAPRLVVAAGATLDRFDEQVLGPIASAMGESIEDVSAALNRRPRGRFASGATVALGVATLLLAAIILAAAGHFPVTLR